MIYVIHLGNIERNNGSLYERNSKFPDPLTRPITMKGNWVLVTDLNLNILPVKAINLEKKLSNFKKIEELH